MSATLGPAVVVADADHQISECCNDRLVVEPQEYFAVGIAPVVELPFDGRITLIDQNGPVLVIVIGNLDQIAGRVVSHILLCELPRNHHGPSLSVEIDAFGYKPFAPCLPQAAMPKRTWRSAARAILIELLDRMSRRK